MIAIPALYEIYRNYPQISTDSRRIIQGSIFFALKGDRFDGNDFALNALKEGAKWAVVDDPKLRNTKNCLYVPNSLTALQRLAKWHRDSLDIPVIGITGSNGKTTTKELISSVLQKKYRILANEGNYNNHIGVPLTILSIPKDTQLAIIEMGANRRGDISMLCHIASPTHGLITNIGRAHLEGLESLDGVRETKSELFYFLQKTKGKIFINADEKSLDHLITLFPGAILFRSEALLSRLNAKVSCISTNPNLEMSFQFKEQTLRIESKLFGAYNFQNVLTAMALGLYFGVPVTDICDAIAEFESLPNRSRQIKKGSNAFFLDAYNANPSSVNEVLDFFETVQHENKVVILGDMLELGPDSESEHLSVLNRLESTSGISSIILVGEIFNKVVSNMKVTAKIFHFKDVEILKKWFEKQGFKNHYFLVKGSRAIALEKLLS